MQCEKKPPRKTFRAYALIISATLTVLAMNSATAAANSTREQQWHLDAMQAEKMWKKSQGEGITVAVLDSGADATLPELKGQLLKGKNFNRSGKTAHRDVSGHGTTMAALIAGTGAENGLRGLAPKAKILPVTIGYGGFDPTGFDRLPEAINYAVDSGAKIVNISSGTPGLGTLPKGTQKAIDRAHKNNVLIFSSSGNQGNETNVITYPSALPGVIAVGATNKAGKAADFSSSGKHLALSAPGTDMPVRCDQNKGLCTGGDGGTSAATALTSASAALIWSKNPTWTNNQVLRAMIETAGRKGAKKGDPPSTEIGYGTVRPRMVILEGEGDPGAPDKHPTFSKYYADLDAKSPSPDSSPDEDSSNNDKQPDQDDKPQPDATTANQDDKGNDTDTTLIIAGTATAALLVAGLVTTVLIRRRSPRTRQAP